MRAFCINCSIAYEGQQVAQVKTKGKKNAGRTVRFDETLRVNMRPENNIIKVSVLDKGNMSDVVMGAIDIDLSRISASPGFCIYIEHAQPVAFQTKDSKGKAAGTVYLGFAQEGRCQDDNQQQEVEGGERQTVFEIVCCANGHNSGRKYHFKSSDAEAIAVWVRVLKGLIKEKKEALASAVQRNRMETLIFSAKKLRAAQKTQLAMLSAILFGFLMNIVDAQLRPLQASKTAHVLGQIDWVLTAIFCFDLLLNFTADFFFPFFKSGWNIFDAIVVISTIATSFFKDINVGTLRVVRLLRAIKLLNRAGSLKSIIVAMMSAVWPVSNSFVLLTLVSAVYAVVGVNVFGDHSPEFFHDFTQGMFTLFECTTGDGWSDIVRRTSTNALGLNADSNESDHATLDTITALYFSSYMVLSSIVLVNIVIAVLLDGFLNTMAQEREKISDALAAADDDFTLARVMNTILDFRSSNNLAEILSNIYDQLDVDGSGSLSFKEAHAGLKKVPFKN